MQPDWCSDSFTAMVMMIVTFPPPDVRVAVSTNELSDTNLQIGS